MIIQQTVIEIRGFFIIFAGGLLAFAIATQHLLRACPTEVEGIEGCGRDDTDFPRNFFYAMSATYFFMVKFLFSWCFACCLSVLENEQTSNGCLTESLVFFFFFRCTLGLL